MSEAIRTLASVESLTEQVAKLQRLAAERSRERAVSEAAARAERAGLARMRQSHPAPFVTLRMLAERGFFRLSEEAQQLSLFERSDLHGSLEAIPHPRFGQPGVFDALVMNALFSIWADGGRDPQSAYVESSATRLADRVGVTDKGDNLRRVVRSVERLKVTSYRYVVEWDSGGTTDTFSLLDRVQTKWEGAATSPNRKLRAKLSDAVLEAAQSRRMIRPVDLSTFRLLHERKELARRLFLFLESAPGHREYDRDLIRRVIDLRLAGTLGLRQQRLSEITRLVRRAGSEIEQVTNRYTIEVAPRERRGLTQGDPRWLLQARRLRVLR